MNSWQMWIMGPPKRLTNERYLFTSESTAFCNRFYAARWRGRKFPHSSGPSTVTLSSSRSELRASRVQTVRVSSKKCVQGASPIYSCPCTFIRNPVYTVQEMRNANFLCCLLRRFPRRCTELELDQSFRTIYSAAPTVPPGVDSNLFASRVYNQDLLSSCRKQNREYRGYKWI